MSNEIIIDVRSNKDVRVALLENGELVEIHIEQSSHQRLTGNIYNGKVSSVLPGMQAAFVDIGYDRNAFLYIGDITNPRESQEDDLIYEEFRPFNDISEILQPGQEITVQVTKEPFGTKGPRVTTNIALAGKYLVLLPTANYIGVSRKIEDFVERNNLRQLADEIRPENMGLIIRTAAEGKSKEDLDNDVNYLVKKWEKIRLKEYHRVAPQCIHKNLGLVDRAIRDFFSSEIDRLTINDRQEYYDLLEFVNAVDPALKFKCEYVNKNFDLFDHYKIDAQIANALCKKVWLRCGGYLVIEQTEALTVIDVNTGKYIGTDNLESTVVRTNLEAATEIAKQLRLRNIGGIIIIDFIDMREQKHQVLILDLLKKELKKDRIKITLIGMTGLGLVELTRKKVGASLSSIMNVICPYCNGKGKLLSPEELARDVEKEISRYFTKTISGSIQVEVHPSVANVLEKDFYMLSEIEQQHNKKIIVKSSNMLKPDQINIKEIDIATILC